MIKSRLLAIMPPGLRIFLDVDDLEDISEVRDLPAVYNQHVTAVEPS